MKPAAIGIVRHNKVIIGGPMMGLRVTSPNMPVIKTTNCIIIEENTPPLPGNALHPLW